MTSGCIESIVIAGRRFTPDADSAGKITPPGCTNEVKPSGDGTVRIVKTKHPGKITDLDLVLKDDDDVDFLTECQNSNDLLPISLTKIDGTVWGGDMQLTEELEEDTKEGIMPIELVGNIQQIG